MEYLLIINNSILGMLLVFVAIMSVLLFKYIRIFNNIYENTENLKKDLKKLNRTLTSSEKEELMKALD
jgi:preprotein translocase subunit YajC